MEDNTAFLSHRRRIRRVIGLMLRHARQERFGEISPLSLAALADEACWSKEHLVRAWKKVFRETPVATSRRIRLDLAAELLLGGASVSQAAERAGFSSVQAFGHAFRRQFGASAREFVRLERAVRREHVELEAVKISEPVDCFGIPYTGFESDELGMTFDLTLSRLIRCGSTPREWRVLGLWADLPEGEASAARPVEMATAVVARNLCAPVRNLSRFTIPAGHYVRIAGARLQSERALDEQILDGGWVRGDGPTIQDFVTDPVTTIPSKRRHRLLIPVVPVRSASVPPSNLNLPPSS